MNAYATVVYATTIPASTLLGDLVLMQQRMQNGIAQSLTRPRIELGTERESFLQVLDEDANFGGTAGGEQVERQGLAQFVRTESADG
jgi:hypothetical protein